MESGGCAPDAAGPSAIISVAGTVLPPLGCLLTTKNVPGEPHAETHHLLPLPPPHTRRQKTARGNLPALVFVLPSLSGRLLLQLMRLPPLHDLCTSAKMGLLPANSNDGHGAAGAAVSALVPTPAVGALRGQLVAVDDEGSTESSSMQLNGQPQQYQISSGPASPLAAETLRSHCCPAAFDADASTVFSKTDFRRCIVAAVPAIPSVTQVAALVPESASRERLPSFAVVCCRPRTLPATETARGCRYHAVV
ncbi:hypothetical protein DFJ73DRAFT_871575 [Zopfochytrium polystomum]|nr:hypothetical protein DFJ73DRAFT_871575 [Zopfochytrium polystomum]